MALGFHFVDNIYSDSQIRENINLINRANPPYVNILGGMQYREALGFAIHVANNTNTRVIFRHYINQSDDGMHTRISPEGWVNNVLSLYDNLNLIVLTDNESMSGDLRRYSDWHARVIELCSKMNVKVAVGRFATHNPPENQFWQLDSMFEAMRKYPDTAILSPNVYWSNNTKNYDGLINAKKLAQYGRRIAGSNMRCVIGEYGIAEEINGRLDPYQGWGSTNLTGKEYIDNAHNLHLQYLLPFDIQVCLYSIGAWPIGKDTFSLDSDAIQRVIEVNMIDIPQNTFIPYSPNDNRWQTAKLKSPFASSLIRERPTRSSSPISTLSNTFVDGFVIEKNQMIDLEIIQSTENNLFWYPVKVGEIVGFVRSDVLVFETNQIDLSKLKTELLAAKIDLENALNRVNLLISKI